MNPHKPEFPDAPEGVTKIDCAAEGCIWIAIVNFSDRDAAIRFFQREHAGQFEEGRVPNIHPEYILSVDCSVCIGGGNVQDVDSETLCCEECGSTWDRDGTNGEALIP